MDNSIFHSSSPHSNLKKKNKYVLNYSTFYHYRLKDKPCCGISVRLPFIVISSKFLEKLRKLLVSGFLFLGKILDWNTVARKSFSFKPLFKLNLCCTKFLIPSEIYNNYHNCINYNNIKCSFHLRIYFLRVFSATFSRDSFLRGVFPGRK